MKIEILILGELDLTRPARATIGQALDHSEEDLGVTVSYHWKSSLEIEDQDIASADGVFVAPGSANENISGIIRGIEIARKGNIPCLGTCGGFQRIVTEYALHALGFETVEHQEQNPSAVDPLFSELSCSLVGKQAEVFLSKGTVASTIYRQPRVLESFFCSYGLNKKHLDTVEAGGLIVSARDDEGEARIVELGGHSFFLGTLFVPQVQSEPKCPHPIINAFVNAASGLA